MERKQQGEQDDIMWREENYLELLRRQCDRTQMEECQTACFSDFVIDNREPDERGKEFLSALQTTAQRGFEQKESSDKPVNAQICVRTDEDDMATWMFLFPPIHGGREITEELIMDVLDECGVVYGVARTTIDRIVREKKYLKLFLAAEGTMPITGTGGSIIDHYPRNQILKEGEMPELEDMERDFRRMEDMHRILAGGVICDVHLPRFSEDGMTVKGEILLGKPIPALELPIGGNIGLNEERTAIISKIDGTLVYDQGKFIVNDILILFSDVDMSTGNIDVIGNLEIHGDVQNGFHVSATESIIIHGMVGNSAVTAGGNISIDMGVRGSSKASLRAGGFIHCKYMENCSAIAKGHIITESIINCDVHSNDFVETQKIVGGCVRALHKVAAKVIGIAQRRETIIYLGLTQETLSEKRKLEDRVQELEASLRELVKGIRYLKSQKKRSEKEEEQLYQMTNREIAQQREVKEHQERLSYLGSVINDMSECELTANLIYPPAKVMMRSDSIFINREQNMCRVWSSDGEMRMR